MKNIPKVCYLFWSRAPMSLLQTFTVVSFHKYNPDWKIIVYTMKRDCRKLGENIYVPEYSGVDHFYLIEKLDYIEIREIDLNEFEMDLDICAILWSDIVRLTLLYNYGGVFSCFDVIWLKPMNEFVNIDCIGDVNDFQSIVSFYEFTHGFHNVSNYISEAGSTYLYSLIQQQRRVLPPYDHQAFSSQMQNIMYPTLESIIVKFSRILAIKYETFYPYSTYHLEKLFIENDTIPINSKNVMCVHWFNGNRFSQDYVRNNDFKDCSMTTILKREGYI